MNSDAYRVNCDGFGDSTKNFPNIDALVKDVLENYRGATVGGFYGKYRVEVDVGSIAAQLKKLDGLLNRRDVQIISLVVEEI